MRKFNLCDSVFLSEIVIESRKYIMRNDYREREMKNPSPRIPPEIKFN